MGALATRLAPRAQDARVLTIDIERLPGLARVFDQRTNFVSHRNFIQSPETICYAARWYGDKTPIFEAAWDDRETMVRRSWELYDEAAAVVTFNGKRFDDKHLRALWLEAGLPAPRPWKAIDLFPAVKQFGYLSSSLDYVTKRLGRPGKVDAYDMNVAFAAMDGDVKAQKRLRRYNIGDVELTEWLYDRLRGWIPNHPHLGAPTDAKVCNQCGSERLKAQPSRYRAVVIDYALYRCERCGANIRAGWHARAATTRGVA
jgi:DNA-directed RNA polymerase subunit RPC12/RpoP